MTDIYVTSTVSGDVDGIESPSSTLLSSSSPSLMDEDSVDVPLRVIHGETYCHGSCGILKQHVDITNCRAEFWEAYAKEILSLHRKKAQDSPSCGVKQDSLKYIYQKQFEDMNEQIQELVDKIKQLKDNQMKEQKKSLELQEELKKTERVKNSYKKQVKDLNALLDEARYPGSTHDLTDKNIQTEMAALQNKVTTMRLQIEGYKSQMDQERAERSIIQGKLDDLQDRYKRREIALDRAQKRCRKLDSYAQILKEQQGKGDEAVMQTTECKDTHRGIHGMDSAVVTPATSSLSTQEHMKHGNEQQAEEVTSLGKDDEEVTDQPQESPAHETLPVSPSEQEEDEQKHREKQEVCSQDEQVDDIVVEAPQESEMSARDYHYERIFGSMELVHIEHVICIADKSITQSVSKMKTLSKMLESSEHELNNLKATCAEQYDQIFRYKNTCLTLKGKVKQLENHVSRLQQSSTEYESQMERLLEQQRQSAAEESHALTSELQHMSQEQARLLLKLHAVEIDLDKSRAICRQLMRRVHSLEQPKEHDIPRVGSSNAKDSGQMPSSPCNTPQEEMPPINNHSPSSDHGNIVSKLQHIAQGLRGLSSPRGISGNQRCEHLT